jgi:hypothetical protein
MNTKPVSNQSLPAAMPLDYLFGPMLLQGLDRELWEADGPPTRSALRLDKLQSAFLPLAGGTNQLHLVGLMLDAHPLKRPNHPQRLLLQVDPIWPAS